MTNESDREVKNKKRAEIKDETHKLEDAGHDEQ
jgi:hypothetical protein